MEERNHKKILIIDDNKDLVMSLVTLLKSEGYSTVIAYDGLYGVGLAHREKVDLIILDLGLPAGSGFFVLENLKVSINTPSIPILVLTAKQGKELEEKAYRMGAAVYVHKPFEPKELLDRIKELSAKG